MLTGPLELIEEARIWGLHGMSRDAWKRYSTEGSWYYEVIRPGFKYNMTDIQAAIGLHQLRKLPQFQARRREIIRRYNEAFSQFEELQTPIERPEVEHAWHLYVVRLDRQTLGADRATIFRALRGQGIGVGVHYIPVHLHPFYRERFGTAAGLCPVAEAAYEEILSLPLFPAMTDEDVAEVIAAVEKVAGAVGKGSGFRVQGSGLGGPGGRTDSE